MLIDVMLIKKPVEPWNSFRKLPNKILEMWPKIIYTEFANNFHEKILQQRGVSLYIGKSIFREGSSTFTHLGQTKWTEKDLYSLPFLTREVHHNTNLSASTL